MIVGVNKYRLSEEADIDVLVVNNETVRSKQIEKLRQVGPYMLPLEDGSHN